MAIIKLHPKRLSDAEYIRGIVQDDERVVSDLYKEWVKYFESYSYNLFFNFKEEKQDIMHDAFIILINKVRFGAIHASDGQVRGKDGKPFSCNLMTFLMSVAVNKKRELIRKKEQLSYWDEVYAKVEKQLNGEQPLYTSEEQVMHEIIAECLAIMPKRCKEILTMFYHEGKSLDDILDFFSKDEEGIRSKDALKTRKNKCMNTLREEANKRYTYYLNH